ncbi:MAG: hypothetical protein KAW94_06960 [Candidatus Thorarchaeota archaeon]|nr:hypothetical protein [Candidatus Thorarchaeota archaeon]
MTRTDWFGDRGYRQSTTGLTLRRLHVLLLLLMLVSSFALSAVSMMELDDSQYAVTHTTNIRAEEPPALRLTYYTRWNSTKIDVNAGDRLEGDHIILNVTWSPSTEINRTRIEVNATAIPTVISNEQNGNSVEIDTRAFGSNFTCVINATIWFHNGTILTELVPDVFLGNFFVPVVEVVSPNGYEVWTGANSITWNAWDLNEDEELTFEVLVSSDSGVTFQLLFAGLTETRFLWDCSTFLNLSTYVIEVRVSDGIFSSRDVSDAPFRAGEIEQLNTTTTTTTTVEEIDPRVIMFLTVLIISSGFIAFVVYYASKKWV